MKVTETSFAAIDDTVAILMDKFHLMAGFPQRSVCLPRNPGQAALIDLTKVIEGAFRNQTMLVEFMQQVRHSSYGGPIYRPRRHS